MSLSKSSFEALDTFENEDADEGDEVYLTT